MTFSFRKMLVRGLIFSFAVLVWPTHNVVGQTVCATVKMVINQQVTLERQAFEATLTVGNGLAFELKDFEVTVWIRETGSSAYLPRRIADNELIFFHKNGVTPFVDVFFFSPSQSEAPESIPSGTDKVYTYLLIPTGNAALSAAGTRYEVGADIKYKPGTGAEESIQVEPDSILVKPLPRLSLEYFLPKSVIANNPNTSIVEPSVPFDLGLRVVNSGVGHAENLKVESFQPRLEENHAGLLVEFRLLDSEVNGHPSPHGLTVNFGELLSGHAGTAAWRMTSTLYGRLSEARATFTHSDALGGALTSLIKETSVFRLVGKVDANFDGIPDFLSVEDFDLDLTSETLEAAFLNLHRSGLQGDGTLAEPEILSVLNLSPHATATPSPSGEKITISFDYEGEAASYSFTRIVDPRAGAYEIASVLRNGVALRKANFSLVTEVRELAGGALDPSGFDYFIDIFDIGNVDGNSSYTVYYGELIRTNRAPIILPLPKLLLREGDPVVPVVVLTVEAVDPDGDPVSLTSKEGHRPMDSTFVDHGDGTATFTWTPVPGLSPFTVVASDGILSSSASTVFNVLSAEEDRLTSWLDQFGLDLEDLANDLDRDGLSVLVEYVLNLDPLRKDTEGLPRVYIVEESGEARVVLECDVISDLAGPIQLSAMVSNALGNSWTELSVDLDPPSSPVPGMTRLRWTDSQVLSDAPRFVRLRVAYEPPAAAMVEGLTPALGGIKLTAGGARTTALGVPFYQSPRALAELALVEPYATQDEELLRLVFRDAIGATGAFDPGADDEPRFFVEFLDGEAAGERFAIAGSGERSVFIQRSPEGTVLATYTGDADRVAIRPYWTIAELAERATAELAVYDSSALALGRSGDAVILPGTGRDSDRMLQRVNGAAGEPDYWADLGAGGDGVQAADGAAIAPGRVWMVRRANESSVDWFISGDASSLQHWSPPDPSGEEILEWHFTLAQSDQVSLNVSGLASILRSSSSAANRVDELIVWEDNAGFYPQPEKRFYLVNEAGEPSWREVANPETDEGTYKLRPGVGYVIRRR